MYGAGAVLMLYKQRRREFSMSFLGPINGLTESKSVGRLKTHGLEEMAGALGATTPKCSH